jgi:hypothetical protein
MLDVHWTPGVPAHLLRKLRPVPALHWMDLCVRAEGPRRAGFHGDGWVRYEDGEPICRWWLEFRERSTFFGQNRTLRIDPRRASADRLRRAWRAAEAHRAWASARLHELRPKIGARTLYHYADGAAYAATYDTSNDGVWASAESASAAPPDNDRALAAEVHRRWIRMAEVEGWQTVIGWAFLAVVASQLPDPKDRPLPRVVRIGDEVFHARVDYTQEVNAYDTILAWLLEPMAEPAEVV